MKNARLQYLCLALLLALAGSPALAQRMQFATPIAELPQPTAAPNIVYNQPAGAMAPTYAPAPGYAAPAYGAPPYGASPYAAPAPGYAPAPAYSTPTGAPAWPSPGGASPYGPFPGASPITSTPQATLDGSIYAPPPTWDPYAMPGAQPQPLMPADPYYPGVADSPQFSFLGPAQRFLQQLRLEYVWMPRGNSDYGMGVNDIDTSVTFAIPFLYNAKTPLLITPGFGVTLFDGPRAPEASNVPPHVFDAYLDTGWNPQLTQWFGAELAFRIGVYSDFERIDDQSLRYQAKGLAVLGFSPSVKIKAGVWYIDRTRIKLLPAGGIVWTPNPDIRFDITFPDPKLARRLTMMGATEWWIYARGEYGGDRWTVDTSDRGILMFDYNDIRVGVGLEFFNPGGFHGLFEVGLAWNREIYFRGGPRVPLDSTVYLRGMITY